VIAQFEPEISTAAIAARRLSVFDVVLALVAIAAHRLGLLETVAFLAVLALVLALAVVALVLWLVGFRRVWHAGDRGTASLAVAAAALALVMAPAAFAAYRLATTPELSDVSTDPENPPAILAPREPPMNPVGPAGTVARIEQAEAYPELTGRRYGLPADRVLDAVVALVRAHGWRLAGAMPEFAPGSDTLVEARARTLLLSLPVDVSIRLSDEGSATYVDMRSSWRYGAHDLGDNAARIGAFLGELDQAIAAESGNVVEE
jgi:hypothetical protein